MASDRHAAGTDLLGSGDTYGSYGSQHPYTGGYFGDGNDLGTHDRHYGGDAYGTSAHGDAQHTTAYSGTAEYAHAHSDAPYDSYSYAGPVHADYAADSGHLADASYGDPYADRGHLPAGDAHTVTDLQAQHPVAASWDDDVFGAAAAYGDPYGDAADTATAEGGTSLLAEPVAETEPSGLIDTSVPAYFGPEYDTEWGPERVEGETFTEWNPSAATVAPVRGRRRARQRGGTMARSRAVLGVGVIAAVGAGGMATAHEDSSGLAGAGDKVKSVPDKIGGFFGGDTDKNTTTMITAAPLTSAGLMVSSSSDVLAAGESADGEPGEALRSRILRQAENQDALAEAEQRDAVIDAAIASASSDAAAFAEEERLEEQERKRAEEERKRKEEEERKKKEEEERLAKLRASFTAPLSGYTLSAYYGQSGGMWSSGYHTGLDFQAPSGTPIKNIHSGTVTQAAWAGSYGYQVIVKLDNGTELSYSHMSSMSVVAGQQVTTGDLLGNVGSTGNSSGPHLHLEVRPGGGSAVDPLSWLRGNGISI
ncbi:M23 family metallopeptidase [Streptomyces bohaiensis]|uniref:M23 family metallopeptidase n=1 Tax=Streptomyces bohaiensis TaxID=1431344 RepID=UPI003B7F8C6B